MFYHLSCLAQICHIFSNSFKSDQVASEELADQDLHCFSNWFVNE